MSKQKYQKENDAMTTKVRKPDEVEELENSRKWTIIFVCIIFSLLALFVAYQFFSYSIFLD